MKTIMWLVGLVLLPVGGGLGSADKPPKPVPLEGVDCNPAAPERPVSDYLPQGPGLISVADAEILRNAARISAEALVEFADEPCAQKSPWFFKLITWTSAAEEVATQKNTNLFLP